jgi:hypothetical protein
VTGPFLLHIIAISQLDISFLHYPFDVCQKMASTHAPSFGVKYPFAPKLSLNHNYFLQTVAQKTLHTVPHIQRKWLIGLKSSS